MAKNATNCLCPSIAWATGFKTIKNFTAPRVSGRLIVIVSGYWKITLIPVYSVLALFPFPASL